MQGTFYSISSKNLEGYLYHNPSNPNKYVQDPFLTFFRQLYIKDSKDYNPTSINREKHLGFEWTLTVNSHARGASNSGYILLLFDQQ